MATTIVGFCLAVIVLLYFYNNPLNHERWFLIGRFINWFPLGMTYAFLYMGRYNLNVSKNALGDLMSKQSLGTIFAAGTVTYAVSFLVNGPLVDKIGGKRGITVDTGLRLSRYFGLNEAFWTGLQLDFDTSVAREELADVLRQIKPLEVA